MKRENSQPLVSIVTVTYNAKHTIKQTIESIVNQSYHHIEYIIIDGASVDGTLTIIEKYSQYIRKHISEPDGGIYDAMNKGISLATGEIIGLLNAGDVYLPQTIEKVVNVFLDDTCDIVHGNMLAYSNTPSDGILIKGNISGMHSKQTINHPTCFVRRRIYEKFGMFDLKYQIASDYEFLLRCMRENVVFYHLDDTLAAYQRGGISTTCKTDIEVYRIKRRYKIAKSYISLFRWLKCILRQLLK